MQSFKTQQKIATILSAYDDLIENNLKRIKLLEEMAEEIYKEMKLVVHCKECQRLHIYCNGFDKDAIIYQICQ